MWENPHLKKFQVLNTTALKLIAVISMTIDHTGCILFSEQLWMSYIGRLAFPIYAFLIVQGYIHTHDVKKYLIRLGLFALISEIPFNLMVSGRYFYRYNQNVFFTLFIGLVSIMLMDRLSRRLPLQYAFWSLVPVALGCGAAYMLDSDYSYMGILMIAIFYAARFDFPWQVISVGLIQFCMDGNQWFAVTAFVPLALYNGKKGPGNKAVQWMFYLYYPLHLLVLCIIRKLRTGVGFW